MKQQKEMTLIKYLFFLSLFVFSCQGTHGEIQAYKADKSMREVEKAILEIDGDSISVINNTDLSGINRPGYMDLILKFDEIRYKISFYGDTSEWKTNSTDCMFSIIEIDGKTNSELGFFSKKKRKGIKAFNEHIISLLEERVGKIK